MDGPERIAQDLLDWARTHPEQAGLAVEYADFVERSGTAAVDRDAGRQHLTASAFVLSPGLDRVLLCFHRKGGF